MGLHASGAAVAEFLVMGCQKNSKPFRREKNTNTADNMLCIGSAVDLYTIDPVLGFDNAISATLKGLYDTLYRYVDNPPRLIPWLAHKYAVSENGIEWDFSLEKNAYFHDGTRVTAEAVKFSFERLLKIAKGYASLFIGIMDQHSVTVIDDYSLKITLLQPYGFFINLLPWLFVLNPKMVKKHWGDDYAQSYLSDHEAGSGPYTIAEWKPCEYYEFKPVINYWKGWPTEKPLAYSRKIIVDKSKRKEALDRGECDMIDWITAEERRVYKKNKFIIIEEPSLIVYEIKINNHNGYTADRFVRKAISYAFDYDSLLAVWAGQAELVNGPLPESFKLGNEPIQRYEYDLEKARESLSYSPWPEGDFTLDYGYVRGLEEELETGEILRRSLQPLGIKVNIIPMAWSDAIASFKHPQTAPSLFPIYTSPTYYSPDNYLWAGYHSSKAGSFTNPGYYTNRKVDSLLEHARAMIDQNERNRVYVQIQKMIWEDAVNIFGVTTPDIHVFSSRIQGLNYCPIMGGAEEVYGLQVES